MEKTSARTLNMQNRWRDLLVWDGILPLAVMTIPWAVVRIFPKNDIAEVSAVVLVPVAAALLRAVLGYAQMHNTAGKVTVVRQFALAIAIVFLMMFEGMVAILTIAKDATPAVWFCPLLLFGCYLVFIAIAFRSKSSEREF